jgi:hypothetical protein
MVLEYQVWPYHGMSQLSVGKRHTCALKITMLCRNFLYVCALSNRSLSQLAAVYPPKTHVVLGAHVRPFPIRKL